MAGVSFYARFLPTSDTPHHGSLKYISRNCEIIYDTLAAHRALIVVSRRRRTLMILGVGGWLMQREECARGVIEACVSIGRITGIVCAFICIYEEFHVKNPLTCS